MVQIVQTIAVVFVSWVGSVWNIIARRATDATKPLGDNLVIIPNVGMEELWHDTHTMPCRKVAVSATFCCTARSSCHTSGIGITSMTKPSTTLGIAMKRAKAKSLRHLPPSIVLSHAYGTGEHWKMAAKVFAMPVPITTIPTKIRTIVKPRNWVVKTRR